MNRLSSEEITLFSGMVTELLPALFDLESGSCFISLASNFDRSRSSLLMTSARDRSNFVSLLRDFSSSY